MTEDNPELVHLDPESAACFPLVKAIIEEELYARIAVERVDLDQAWATRVAGIAADALLHRFQVRERTAENPLYRSTE